MLRENRTSEGKKDQTNEFMQLAPFSTSVFMLHDLIRILFTFREYMYSFNDDQMIA